MLTFYLYFGIACVIVFALICLVSYAVEREKRDVLFAEKMDRWRLNLSRLDPYSKFAKNLFWWVVVFIVVFYIYLG